MNSLFGDHSYQVSAIEFSLHEKPRKILWGYRPGRITASEFTEYACAEQRQCMEVRTPCKINHGPYFVTLQYYRTFRVPQTTFPGHFCNPAITEKVRLSWMTYHVLSEAFNHSSVCVSSVCNWDKNQVHMAWWISNAIPGCTYAVFCCIPYCPGLSYQI